MTYRTLALLFAALLALPIAGIHQASAQDATPDTECTANPVWAIELERDALADYLAAPDAPADITAGITSVLEQYVEKLSGADVQGALDLMTPELADYFGWDCDPRMTEATPEATPATHDYAVDQVRLFDDDTATAFLSLRDVVHDTTAGTISDRVFFIILELVDDEWKIDAIGTVVLVPDAVPERPVYIPTLDLRDDGMPELPPSATPRP